MEFQGFQHSVPLLILLGALASLIAVAWISYSRLRSIPVIPRLALTVLRGSALVIVLILLLNPYFFSSETVEKKPRILVLLDDSESMTLSKGVYNGSESYRQVLDELRLSQSRNFDLEYFTIGSSSRQLASPDSLRFLESETNFTNAISQVQELEDDFDAGIILSDGIITFGRNPVIQASNLSIPLYTIALGDTSSVRDITIKNVISNPTGYSDTRHIVEVEVSQNGFRNHSANVEILDINGNVIETDQVSFSTDEEVQSVRFEIPLDEPGLKQYQIRIQHLPEEWTTENNQSTFSIEVLDSKIRILHIAFEVHPDVKMFRSILAEDENIELSTLTWLGGTRFIEDLIPEINEQDLIIYHGVPANRFNTSAFSGYELIPSLYLQLPRSRRTNSSAFPEVKIIQNTGNQLFEVSLSPMAENTDHPIMELPEIGYENIAPVVSSLRTASPEADALTLFNIGFQSIETPNPMIAVLERGSIRRGAVAAWEWFKMYQSPNPAEKEFVATLFSNLAIWASNDPDDRRLKISPGKPSFNISESVIINANLNNESGEPESQATVEVVLSSGEQEQRSFNMSNEGNGTYQLEISTLSPGLYSYSATARKGDREIDAQSGEFLVEDSNSEFINTERNDELMATLAHETGGTFFIFDQLNEFWSTLDSDGVLEPRQELLESYTFPVRSLFWFVLVIVLLSSEWLLRKYYSLP